ncbi:hypothetical protein GGS21DRAFT_190924 [Xylaria nigripes]|nr:hypothetical protein GGS21DRAFT_190924 [Xylaria nigripes]
MMDQLSTVGCEFKMNAIDRLFDASVKYYINQDTASAIMKSRHARRRKRRPLSWAEESIHESNKPIRPWALHSIRSSTGPLYNLIGSVTRAPGMYHKINPKDGHPLPEFLEDTNERIHPSVRVRLACEGLGLNDTHVWCCPSLLGYWRPVKLSEQSSNPVVRTTEWGPTSPDRQSQATLLLTENQGEPSSETHILAEGLRMLSQTSSEQWVWEYIGPKEGAPSIKRMAEERLGPFEQRLLMLAAGKIHVYEYSEEQDVKEFKVFHFRGFRKMMKHFQRKHRKKAKKDKKKRSKQRKAAKP